MLAQLLDGELDLALGLFPELPQDITVQPLFADRFISVADRQVLPASGGMALEDWLARPHVLMAMRPDAFDEIERALAARGLQRRIALALPHWSAAVEVLAGPDLILGGSSYDDLARARELLDAGADYIAFGAMFPSRVKPDTVRAPLSVLTEARALVEERDAPRPAVVAIGGITPDNAALVAAAGADSVAVITGLFEAPAIRAAAAACAAPYSINRNQKP